MNNKDTVDNNNKIELLADYAHSAWSGWMNYLFEKSKLNDDGSFTIWSDSVKLWERKMKTPYSELTEKEKESDRIEARKMLDIINRQGVNLKRRSRIMNKENCGQNEPIQRKQLASLMKLINQTEQDSYKLRDITYEAINSVLGREPQCVTQVEEGKPESECWADSAKNAIRNIIENINLTRYQVERL